MTKIIIAASSVAFMLSGCVSNDINPLHISDVYTPTNVSSVKYIAPTSNINISDGISGITFDSYSYGPASKQHKLFYKKVDQDTFEVHRRVDNGVGGSGIIFHVDFTSINEGNNTIIEFKPTESKSYQQGFIGKFDVPELDITNFLTKTNAVHTFEVNSEYPADAVKANFERMLKKKQPNQKELQQMMIARMSGKQVSISDSYVLSGSGFEAMLKVESFPYRNGSKVVVTSNLTTTSNLQNEVNLSEIYKVLESEVTKIINS